MLDPGSRASPPPVRRWGVRFALGALVAAALYAALALVADVREVGRALEALQPRGLALALGLVFAACVVRSLRWRLYMHHLQAVPPHGPVCFVRSLLLGLSGGRWGLVAKAYYLGTRARLPYARTVPAVVAERVADTAGVVLLFGLAFGIAGGSPGPLVMAAAVLAITMLALRHEPLARGAVARLQRFRWARRHAHSLIEGQQRLREHLHWRDVAVPAVIGLSAVALEALALHALAVTGFGLQMGVAQAMLLVATVDVVGMVSMMPGGLGAAEGSLVALLSLQGVPLAEAAALTVVYRLATLWFSIGLGMAGIGLLFAWPHAAPEEPPGAPAQA